MAAQLAGARAALAEELEVMRFSCCEELLGGGYGPAPYEPEAEMIAERERRLADIDRVLAPGTV